MGYPLFLRLIKQKENNMKDTIISEITGKSYDPTQCVRILNSLQACKYVKHGCELLDVYPSVDFKTGQDVWVYIFDRAASQPYYKRWCDHTL